MLNEQARKLRSSIARRKADSQARVVGHYEQVLADLEYQIAQLSSAKDGCGEYIQVVTVAPDPVRL